MRSYAAYLNTMTVKALNVIARDMGLKGYSKLRKAALIAFIDDAIVPLYEVAIAQLAETFIAAQVAVPAMAEVPVEVFTPEVDARINRVVTAIDKAFRDARSLVKVTGGTDAERSDTYGTNMGPKVAPVKVTSVEVEADETEELIYAYRAMRRTIRDMGNVPARISIVNRMRKLSADLRAAKVDMRTV